MAMNAWVEELGSWFELCSEAILGVQNGIIVFQNTAAIHLLGDRRDEELSILLPCCPEEPEEGNFTFSGPWENNILLFSGQQRNGLMVLRAERTGYTDGVRVGARLLGALRSILYQIQLPAERLLRMLPEKEDDLYGSSLRHACYTMRNLVENLGDLNELSSGTLEIAREAVDFAALSARLIETVRCLLDENRVTLEEQYEGECFVEGDSRRLEQILARLLCNAIARMPRGGRLRVRMRKKGGWVRLTVEDNGEAVPPHQMGRMFTSCAWEEADIGSEGLGLSLVWELTKLHNGRTMVESREGQGTKVYLEFPATVNLPLRDGGGESLGMTGILTEMSRVLTHRAYRNRYMD